MAWPEMSLQKTRPGNGKMKEREKFGNSEWMNTRMAIVLNVDHDLVGQNNQLEGGNWEFSEIFIGRGAVPYPGG